MLSLTLLSNVKKRVEDWPNFCGLLRISELYWKLQLHLSTVVFDVLYCTSKITASLRLDCLLPSRNGLAVDLYCVNYKQKYSI